MTMVLKNRAWENGMVAGNIYHDGQGHGSNEGVTLGFGVCTYMISKFYLLYLSLGGLLTPSAYNDRGSKKD
jgi:hypothetical protein